MLARFLGVETAFPWQVELLRRFVAGEVPAALDIPTGLGKTSVMAIWLAARAAGAPVPRRLVYIVDRRAVVDQSTGVAEDLREQLATDPALSGAIGLAEDRHLPISTLRGRFVDNREWLEDPASPGIVVGTVDMIGSRLLFQGYGTSRRMRPYQAGLLACDSLLVLDEAHLVPPFARLVDDLATASSLDWHADEPGRPRAPRLRRIALSATGRLDHADGQVLRLTEEDQRHDIVRKRIEAEKLGNVVTVGDDRDAVVKGIVDEVVPRLGEADNPERILVFTDKRDHAEKVAKALVKEKVADVELFVGARRIRERSEAAQRLADLGFLAGADTRLARSAVVVATSAGEVGVDLDADHMVADVVSWERTVQRLGRVNRRGSGSARVTFVATTRQVADARKIADDCQAAEHPSDVTAGAACLALIDRLPRDDGGRCSLSPRDILRVTDAAASDPVFALLLRAATTRGRLRPAGARPILESWAMTSLDVHTGRPDVAPWIRGWVENDKPRTSVAWRHHLPIDDEGHVSTRLVGELFRAAPVQASELLETETFRVVDWLRKRVKVLGQQSAVATEEVVGVLLDTTGEVIDVLDVDFVLHSKKDRLERLLEGRTLVVRDSWAGLATSGLLDSRHGDPPHVLDLEQPDDPWLVGASAPFRVRLESSSDDAQAPPGDVDWVEARRIPIQHAPKASSEDDRPPSLVVEIRRATTTDEESRSAGNPQRLDAHHAETAEHARLLAERLGLDDASRDLLVLAARIHDEGKRASRWQRAFGAPPGGDWAKTRGPVDTSILDGYRHELGSYLRARDDLDVRALDGDARDLVLHLIASHHGHARPVIPTRGCDEAPPTVLRRHAADIAERFVCLQRCMGPWQLAWWEAVLRAADQQASRANDARRPSRLPAREVVA